MPTAKYQKGGLLWGRVVRKGEVRGVISENGGVSRVLAECKFKARGRSAGLPRANSPPNMTHRNNATGQDQHEMHTFNVQCLPSAALLVSSGSDLPSPASPRSLFSRPSYVDPSTISSIVRSRFLDFLSQIDNILFFVL